MEWWRKTRGELPQDHRPLDDPTPDELAELEAAGGRLIAPALPAPPPSTAHPLHETVHAAMFAHGTIVEAIAATSQAQHAELVAAGRETEPAEVAESLGRFADLEATFPPLAVHSRRDRNEP